MSRRPCMAIGIIICGLIMIIAGLGYTISRTSNDSSPDWKDHGEIRTLEEFKNTNSIWYPHAHKGDRRAFTTIPGEGARQDVQAGACRESNLLYPALTLLSGVALAVVGALSLLHRWHSRGIRLSG